MNYDTLSEPRQNFIDSFILLDEPLCHELSDLFIEATSWQGYRILVFNYLDTRINELNSIRGQLVKL